MPVLRQVVSLQTYVHTNWHALRSSIANRLRSWSNKSREVSLLVLILRNWLRLPIFLCFHHLYVNNSSLFLYVEKMFYSLDKFSEAQSAKVALNMILQRNNLENFMVKAP